MIDFKKEFVKNPMKIAGGALLLGSSLALFFHRMPHHAYVEVHADRPRPKAAADVQSPAPAQPIAKAAAVPRPAAMADSKHPGAAPAAVEVAGSTTPTIDSIYTVARQRDPFAHWGAGRGTSPASATPWPAPPTSGRFWCVRP